MKYFLSILYLMSIGYTTSAQQYCKYCLVFTDRGVGGEFELSNIYSIPQQEYSMGECFSYRDDIVQRHSQLISFAQQNGRRLKQYFIRSTCDEQAEINMVNQRKEDKKREQDAKIRAEQNRIQAEQDRRALIAKQKLERKKAQAASRSFKVQKTWDLYESKGPKPDSIADGWHWVTLIENEALIYEKPVRVSANRIQEYWSGSDHFSHILHEVSSGPIQQGKTLFTHQGKFLDVLFLKYLDNPASRAEAPQTGSLMFWTQSEWGGSITIQLDRRNKGRIDAKANSLHPDCGSENTLTLSSLKTGTYEYHATSQRGQGSWNGTITILPNECTSQYIDVKMGKICFGTDQEAYLPIQIKVWDDTETEVYSGIIENPSTAIHSTDSCSQQSPFSFYGKAGTYSYLISSQKRGYEWIETKETINLTAEACKWVSPSFDVGMCLITLDKAPANKKFSLYLNEENMGPLTEQNGRYSIQVPRKPGRYAYLIEDKDKDYEWEGSVELSGGTETIVELGPAQLYGQALFYIDYPKVEKNPVSLYVNGAYWGKLTRPTKGEGSPWRFGRKSAQAFVLPAGRHRIHTESPGKWKWDEFIEVNHGARQVYRLANIGGTCVLQRTE